MMDQEYYLLLSLLEILYFEHCWEHVGEKETESKGGIKTGISLESLRFHNLSGSLWILLTLISHQFSADR